MAQNQQIDVGSANWTQITDAAVTAITFQNVGSFPIMVTGTPNTTPPAAEAGGLLYAAGQGEANRLLADLFPGVASANRVWARSTSGTQKVFVSNA